MGGVAPGGADGVGRGMYRAGQKKCKGNPERIESKAHLHGSVLQPPACGTIPSGSRGPATHSGRWTVLRNSSHYFACNRDVAAGTLNFSHQSPTLDNTRSRSARSEEHTSELQSLMRISYAVFCLKKKKT